jgi:hypothetical protein
LLEFSPMKHVFAGVVTMIAVTAVTAPNSALAGSGDVAAGLLGGFAVGAIVGSALAPRPAPVYVAPGPVYVAPGPVAPVYGEPACYWTRGRPVWDGYRWVRPRVQICD